MDKTLSSTGNEAARLNKLRCLASFFGFSSVLLGRGKFGVKLHHSSITVLLISLGIPQQNKSLAGNIRLKAANEM